MITAAQDVREAQVQVGLHTTWPGKQNAEAELNGVAHVSLWI